MSRDKANGGTTKQLLGQIEDTMSDYDRRNCTRPWPDAA